MGCSCAQQLCCIPARVGTQTKRFMSTDLPDPRIQEGPVTNDVKLEGWPPQNACVSKQEGSGPGWFGGHATGKFQLYPDCLYSRMPQNNGPDLGVVQPGPGGGQHLESRTSNKPPSRRCQNIRDSGVPVRRVYPSPGYTGAPGTSWTRAYFKLLYNSWASRADFGPVLAGKLI
jgi:hypothetical protein